MRILTVGVDKLRVDKLPLKDLEHLFKVFLDFFSGDKILCKGRLKVLEYDQDDAYPPQCSTMYTLNLESGGRGEPKIQCARRVSKKLAQASVICELLDLEAG